MKMKHKLLPLFFVCCVVFVTARVFTKNVQAADSINLGSVEITFHIPETEITITEAETLAQTDVIIFTVDLVSTDTGFTPDSAMWAVWYHNEVNTSRSTQTTLGNFGVNPLDANKLVSNSLAMFLPSDLLCRGEWHIRVYIAGHFVGASDPVRINVIPARSYNLEQVRVDFNIFYDEFTLMVGDPLHNKIEYMIDLVSTNTGLTPRTMVHVQWYINGEPIAGPLIYSLHSKDIIPTNPHQLSTSFEGLAMSFINIDMQRAGDWTLRIYIAGQLIGESDPIRVNVLPALSRNLESVDVSFNILSDTVTLVSGESHFVSVIESKIDLQSLETGLSQFSAVRLDWVIDGEFYQEFDIRSLRHYGINPFSPNLLTSDAISSSFRISSANERHEGNWTLRVYLENRLVGESTPIRVNVVPPVPFFDANPSDWFYRDVAFVYQHGLMVGVAQGRFSPYSPVTRGMVAHVLFNMHEEPATAGAGTSFSDVEIGRWYAEAITWAYENGLVSGFGDGTFRPSQYITRAHLTLLLSNYACFVDAEPPTLQLDLHGNAIRAELAAMLRNFLGDSD